MKNLSELNETMYVTAVDLDCEKPYCKARFKDGSIGDVEMLFAIPKELAYYQRNHFCGSEKMRGNYLEQGRKEIQWKIKDALDI